VANCLKCNALIVWRTSAKSGRRYMVNGDASLGPVGAFHSAHCPKRLAVPITEEQHKTAEIAATWPPLQVGFETKTKDKGDLASIIAQHVASLIPASKAALDEDRVREIVRESSSTSIVVSVRDSDKPAIDVGRQHKQFPTLLAVIARRRNLWLTGPAGSGKTMAAHKAADALGLAFGSISIGPQTTQSALFGYMDAHGNYVATEFRRRYEQGGVFLFDEIDRGNPGVLTALNQAIENSTCAFPDAMIPKHVEFVAIAAANTYGNGASREYVGALQLDAATLDRFAMLAWEYDEGLETDIATATYKAAGGSDAAVLTAWLGKVRKARAKAAELKVRHIVSPRASIVGADLLASGLDERTVASLALWKGLDADTITRLS